MKRVLILLSTYNGHSFLRDQLDSLYAQEEVDIHILVRDDGSKDDTVKILENYKARFGKMTILAHLNIGCARSFYSLVNYAATEMPRYDYYAFCDQDDVWLPEKLHRAVEKLDEHNGDNKLYFCCANYVDADLNFIRKTNPPKYFDYKTCVFRNPVLGCTMLLDYTLLELANRRYEERMAENSHFSLHDAWIFNCANFLNSYIYSDENAFINYRQHGNNVTTAERGLIQRYKGALMEVVKNKNRHYKGACSFLQIYDDILDKNKRAFLFSTKSYKDSFFMSCRYLFLQPWKGEPFFDKILWTLLVILKKF